MKHFKRLCLVLGLISVFSVFSLTACNDAETEKTVTYEITVDASAVTVELGTISVCLYTLDGTLVEESKLTGTKAEFEVEEDSYIATLSGLSEEISYTSVMLKDAKKATIALEASYYDDFEDITNFNFTLFVISSDEVQTEGFFFLQVCNDKGCRFPIFDENDDSVANVLLSDCGEYEVDAVLDGEEIYKENHTVTLNMRYCVIRL